MLNGKTRMYNQSGKTIAFQPKEATNMEWMNPSELPAILQEKCRDKLLEASFTQWEDDDSDADETITTFKGYLLECMIAENAFHGLDGCFYFQSEQSDEITEILMDFPADGEDVIASLDGDKITLYGNESTLAINIKGL